MGGKPRFNLHKALVENDLADRLRGGTRDPMLFINGHAFECSHRWAIREAPHSYIGINDPIGVKILRGTNPVIILLHNNRDVGGKPTRNHDYWFKSEAAYWGDPNHLIITTDRYCHGTILTEGRYSG